MQYSFFHRTASQNHQTQTGQEGPFFAKETETEAAKEGTNGSFFDGGGTSAPTGFFSSIQTKPAKNDLTIGQPGDKYEVEADAVADKVVQRLNTNTHVTQANDGMVQRKCAECMEEEKVQPKEELLADGISHIQRKPIFESEENPVQTKCEACEQEEENLQKKEEEQLEEEPEVMTKSQEGGGTFAGGLQSELSSTKGGGSPLPKNTRTGMESAFGTDFSGVRLHTGNDAVQMNRGLNAQAFTHGSDIYFNEGKYDTHSSKGQHLLAHELTHVVQQSGMIQKDPLDTDAEGEEGAAGSCPNYDHGEISRSRTSAGILGIDTTFPAADKVLIADFGNNRSTVKASTQSEANFLIIMSLFDTDRSLRFIISGYSDCSGSEEGNTNIRHRRAEKVESALSPSAQSRVSLRGMAGLGQFITSNGTPEDRAKNRSVEIQYKHGFFFEQEAIENAIGSQTAIENALIELGTSSEMHEKNIPQFLTDQSITLEPLTPRHDTNVMATAMKFFAGTTNYANSFDLPSSVRFHVHNSGSNIAVHVRDTPIMDDLLPNDQIRERIVQAVTQVATFRAPAHGSSATFEIYRSQFNGWWEVDPFNTMSSHFDPALDSKGPRTPRSRAIFERIYNENPTVKAAYDSNAFGIKERIDTYMGPDSINMLNSPRLQDLRDAFLAFSPPVSNADYASFKTSVQTASDLLDASDRQAIDASNEWQRMINEYLTDNTKRTEIRQILRTAPPAPAPPAPPAPPPGPAPGTGAVQGFLDHISIDGPTSPVLGNNLTENVTLTPKSDRANPGLSFNTQFTVTPSSRVSGNNISPESSWPLSSDTGVSFGPDISNTGTVTMNAHLDLKNLPSGVAPTTPVSDFTFTLNDNRQANFLATWTAEFTYNTGSNDDWYNSGDTVRYQHGTQNFEASAWLPSSSVNPGLTLSVNARVKRGSAVLASNPTPQSFPSAVRSSPPIALNIAAPGSIPAGGDPLTMEIDILDAGGAVIGTKTVGFNVLPENVYTRAQAMTAAKEDDKYIHDNSSSGLLGKMSARGGVAAKVADAVNAPESEGGITLLPMTIRHDSQDYLNKVEGAPNPARVGYFVSTSYKPVRFFRSSYPNSMASVAGAAAFHTGNFPHFGNRVVILNRTTDVPANSKRSDDSLITLLIHEATHSMDERPDSGTEIERYKTEFRAYWMDGRYGPPDNPDCVGATGTCHEAKFDPSLPPPGPKSPRARTIFNHLYGSTTYPFVKPAYDENRNGFRAQVDNYLIPDGINLIVSQRLELLRAIIENYGGSNFSDLRNQVRQFTGAVAPAPVAGVLGSDEKDYIKTSRAWRDLVERKFTNNSERNTIISDLGIPQ